MAEPSAHDTAMAAKVDAVAAAAGIQSAPTPLGTVPAGAPAAPAPVVSATPRPEHIPEKFWNAEKGEVNVEAMAKSYTELEKGKAPAAATPAATTPPADDAAAAAAAALAAAPAGTPSMDALSAEFAEKGALAPESYAALEKAGIGKAMVDAYIDGQKAIAAARDNTGFALAGGQEQFNAMATWAQTSLSPADVAALNAGLAGNEAQMKLAITSLRGQYEAANGREPTLVKGNAAENLSGEAPFASRAEVTVAMRDPRYKADPAYRAMVERRVGAMPDF